MPTRRPTRIDLPAAGHARNEELRRRTDALEEQGEMQFGESGAIDPAKLQIDREAAHKYVQTDGYEVTKPQPGHVYCWVREDKPGSQVRWKQSQRVQMPDGGWAPLWEVVQGTDPESVEEKDVRGYRKIVDCILLRAKAERHRQYQIEEERRKHEQQHGSSDALEDLASKSKGYVKVYSEVEMSQHQTTLERAQQAGFARSKFTQKLREGTAHQV